MSILVLPIGGGGLWLAHDNSGISHIAAPVGLSEFGEREGIAGNVNDVVRHQGSLYVATDANLYRLRDRLDELPAKNPSPVFETIQIQDAGKIYWALLSFGDELIVATEVGVFGLKDGVSYKIGFSTVDRPKSLIRSRKYPNRIYAGKENGLSMMTRNEDGWKVVERLGPLRQHVTSLAEDIDGALWATSGNQQKKLWRAHIDDEGKYIGETLIPNRDLLKARFIRVERLGDRVAVLAPPFGIFRYQKNLDTALVRDNALLSDNGSVDSLVVVRAINDAQFIAIYENYVELVTLGSKDVVARASPLLLRLPNWEHINSVYQDDNGRLWISHGQTLLRYDPNIHESEVLLQGGKPLIRRVSMVWADSILYGGALSREAAIRRVDQGKVLAIALRHDDNDLRFDFAMPEFSRRGKVEYRHMLTGHDKGWSDWTLQPTALYRNVDAGSLQFRVMARAGGRVSPDIATISLKVRPPWFWTWWSKLAYLLFLALPVYQIVRFQRAQRQLVELEKERKLNERLNRANEQLREANQSLEKTNKMKDEFLANASHELRTPLTAILGFTSVLKEEVPLENQEFLSLIDENGKRLLQTITSLLDLAKLRAGMLQLNFQRLDVGSKAEEVVDLLTQLAKNQGLYMEVHQPVERVMALLDAHCFERILFNLIGNAIKFTQHGGIKVVVERVGRSVKVNVRDTGIGIGEKFIPMLFDEFKQEPANQMHAAGSGLGLTITAELVELMNGTISVESKKAVGSTFTVSFPLAGVEPGERLDKVQVGQRETSPSTI